jgi:hypothetical protein
MYLSDDMTEAELAEASEEQREIRALREARAAVRAAFSLREAA